jgi:hypothetical protein
MLTLLLSALSGTALAAPPEGFGSARLVSGTPDFSSCIESGGACQADFYRFLGNSMLEQGFAMQHHALLTSPVSNRRAGWVAGGDLATFPFAPPRENLSGKQENTSFSPVFPQVVGGYVFEGSRDGQGAVGLSLLPPVPVGGASALSVALDTAYAWGPADGARWGLEGGLAYVRATAPIVATQDQVANRDEFSNPDNLDPVQFAAVCGEDVAAGADGCLDTFSLINLTIRGGWSPALGTWAPYAKAGITVVNELLVVKYDDTTWGVFAVQPSVHGGTSWAPGDHVLLAVGASAALQQANQSEEDRVGLFGTLEGAAGWRF